MNLEKKISAKAVREHFNNEAHVKCRMIDYYLTQGMTIKEAMYCTKNKYERLYQK